MQPRRGLIAPTSTALHTVAETDTQCSADETTPFQWESSLELTDEMLARSTA